MMNEEGFGRRELKNLKGSKNLGSIGRERAKVKK